MVLRTKALKMLSSVCVCMCVLFLFLLSVFVPFHFFRLWVRACSGWYIKMMRLVRSSEAMRVDGSYTTYTHTQFCLFHTFTNRVYLSIRVNTTSHAHTKSERELVIAPSLAHQSQLASKFRYTHSHKHNKYTSFYTFISIVMRIRMRMRQMPKFPSLIVCCSMSPMCSISLCSVCLSCFHRYVRPACGCVQGAWNREKNHCPVSSYMLMFTTTFKCKLSL